MSLWIPDFQEQIAFARFLSMSKLPTGKRLGFIILDNTVELMFKVYLYYKRSITGRKQGQVSLEDWEAGSRNFPDLLKWMKRYGSLQEDLAEEINQFHDTRCKLYHSETPMDPRPTVFQRYSEIAIDLLRRYFKVGFSTTEQNTADDRIRRLLGATPCPEVPPIQVEGDPLELAIRRTDNSISISRRLLTDRSNQIRAVFYGLQHYLSVMPVTPEKVQDVLRLNGLDVSLDDIRAIISARKARDEFHDHVGGCFITDTGIRKLTNHIRSNLKV